MMDFCRKGLVRAAVLAALTTVLPPQAQPQALQSAPKQIAVTIDDLPLNGPDIGRKRLRRMTKRMLTALTENKVPTIGFVNESLLYVPGEVDERIAILKMWADAGMELGNHTFSHMRFKDIALEEFQNDVVRGEVVTAMIAKERGKKLRYFRHPFLQMGTTRETEMAFENFLAARGYRMAPITVDSMDWMFLTAYREAKERGDSTKSLAKSYVEVAGKRTEYSEQISRELFGRQIPQILLLHANELAAEALPDVLKMLKDRGYEFIPLEKALEDKAYSYPGRYQDNSDWLNLWAFSKGIKFSPPQPPEDVQKIFSRTAAGK